MIAWPRLIADLFYTISMVAFYCTLTSRVHQAFQESAYKLSRCLLVTLISLICVYGLLLLSYEVILFLWQCGITSSWLQSPYLLGSLEVGALILDEILNITLLFIFLTKIKRVILAQSTNNLKEILLQKSQDIELYETQTAFVDVMAKFSVLSIFA